LEEIKMKKILPMLIMGLIVLSGLGAAAFTTNDAPHQQASIIHHATTVRFPSTPTLSETDGFTEIHLNGATTTLLDDTKPKLPVYVKTYQIPFRSTNIKVTCTPQDIGTQTITNDVLPVTLTTLSNTPQKISYEKDHAIYSSAALYPDTWFTYDLGAGRNEQNIEVTFLKIVCHPVRYSPLNKQLTYASQFSFDITYTEPLTTRTLDTTYDMVIIAPAKFEAGLQKLIDFKNEKGIKTTFKSMEDIRTEYKTIGYDEPEQVKYFIKDAYDNWNITYVLLVGGLKNHIYAKDKDTASAGWKAWWVPVRYVNMPHEDDEGCLCDLYYGCLYNETGVFDSWDSTGDHVYAAWGAPGVLRDKFDMYPEVYVSRLPVANKLELNHIVNKIITYESTGPAAKPWYKTFIGIAGKTFYMWQGQPDGEFLCDLAYNYTKLAVPGLTQIKVYCTNRDTGGLVPDKTGISSAFNQGAGFVDFEGHGSPSKWDTIWFDGIYPDDWVGGISIDKFILIHNGNEQPVVVVGGCHNGLYNITTLAAMLDKTGKNYFSYGYPIFTCFSWGLIIKPRGGAIASTGCTGYGIGSNDGDPSTILSAELESNFFYYIGQGTTHLAEAHSQAIQKYVSENTIYQTDAFCITNWALFGDPSLLFGGYST
jgi:hypothetical protein